jgi:hypothetical protein
VYVPGAVTLVAAVVAPLLQEYVPPPVAVKPILVAVHVRTVVVGAVIAATGEVIFCVIVIDSVSVQPFAAVTVTVYVPGAVTLVAAVVAPLLQEYVPPPVAVKPILVAVHVRTVVVGVVIAATGEVIFCVIVIDSVSVQPFAEVTVTVYVPGAVTLVAAVVAPLLQEYVPPPVAVKPILVVVHVRTVVVGVVIAATGAVLFCVIVIDSVSVHPFVAVTVTVYVPAELTLVAAVVAPLLQEYVPPPVAVKPIPVVVHVKTVVVGAVIAATGAVLFCVIVMDSVSVQPFVAVTVTV